jgi:hypothetical protein
VHFKTTGFPPDIEDQWRLTAMRFYEWVRDELFSPNWWILAALFVLTALIWWKKVDKSRLGEMLLYTALIIIFIIILDELGEELSLWYYTADIFPLFPPINAVDISCMPAVYMLVYQYSKNWKAFIIATVVMALVFCFVFEPIFVWSGIYAMLTWKSYYGLPIYIFIGLASKAVISIINSVSAPKKM